LLIPAASELGYARTKMIEITECSNPLEIADERLRSRALQAKVTRARQYLARLNGVEVGYLSFDDRSDIGTGVIYEMLVLPPFRLHGIGSELVRFAESLARSCKYSRIRLCARAFDSTVAQDWLEASYEKRGYGMARDGSQEFEKLLAS
jgi:GNAT superfamily N-acetyltransferase